MLRGRESLVYNQAIIAGDSRTVLRDMVERVRSSPTTACTVISN